MSGQESSILAKAKAKLKSWGQVITPGGHSERDPKRIAKPRDRRWRTPLPDYSIFPFPDVVRPIPIPHLQDLYQISQNSVVLYTIHNHLNQEIFRRGFKFVPKFKYKCESCQSKILNAVDVCPNCGGTDFSPPDLEQLRRTGLEVTADGKVFMDSGWMGKANRNRQTFLEVNYQCEKDLEIVDDAYLITRKNYFWTPEGIMQSIFPGEDDEFEIYRASPLAIQIAHDNTGLIGSTEMTCAIHRDISVPKDDMGIPARPDCEHCGRELYDVEYYEVKGQGTAVNRFIPGEVIHFSKYSPTMLYSEAPPVQACWQEAHTLYWQAYHNFEYYQKGYNPNGILAIWASDPASVNDLSDTIKEKRQENWHYIPLVGMEVGPNGETVGKIEYIDIASSLIDMEFIDVRNDFRRRIYDLYGLKIDTEGFMGGMQEGSMKLKISQQAIEMGQHVWERKVYPRLFETMGITDWSLEILPSEEQDMKLELDISMRRTQEAIMRTQLGFAPKELDPETGKFSFDRKPTAPPMMGGGGMGDSPFSGIMGQQPGGGRPPMDQSMWGNDMSARDPNTRVQYVPVDTDRKGRARSGRQTRDRTEGQI